VQGLVMSSIGETRAHGSVNSTATESLHVEKALDGHGHAHGHVHAERDRHHLHHESGSHFHETADRLAAGEIIEPLISDSLRICRRDGIPLRRAFRLERPPRPVSAV